MKTLTLLSALLGSLILPTASYAQETIPKMSAEELAARKSTIPAIEARLIDRKEQLEELRQDIQLLDERVENRINKVVDSIATLRDSNDSKTLVARTKRDVMEGLGRAAQAYTMKRREILEENKKSSIAAGDTAEEIAAVNQRANRRIDQMIEISKSFTAHEDYDKYKTTGVNYDWSGWGYTVYEDNPDWKQNRREVKQTDAQRKAFTEALRKSVESLEQRVRLLEDLTKRTGLTEAERSVNDQDLKATRTMLYDRHNQLLTLQTSPNVKTGGADDDSSESASQADAEESVATSEVGSGRAHEIQKMIQEIATDIRSDMQELFSKYDEFRARRTEIKGIEANLVARKKWLADYAAQHGE